MAENKFARRKRAKAQSANRDAAAQQLRDAKTTNAAANETSANAAMLNAQQQMALTKQRGQNLLARTGLRNTGQMNLAVENNAASAQKQLSGFEQRNKETMQGQNWDKDKMRMNQDFARETLAANRGFQVEDQATNQANAMETAAFKLAGDVYQDSGDPNLAAGVASGDFNSARDYTPAARLAKPDGNRYQFNAGKFNKDDRLSPDTIFDKKRGVAVSSSAMNTINRLQNMGSQEEANAFVSELQISNPDLYKEILGYISLQ